MGGLLTILAEAIPTLDEVEDVIRRGWRNVADFIKKQMKKIHGDLCSSEDIIILGDHGFTKEGVRQDTIADLWQKTGEAKELFEILYNLAREGCERVPIESVQMEGWTDDRLIRIIRDKCKEVIKKKKTLTDPDKKKSKRKFYEKVVDEIVLEIKKSMSNDK